MEHGDQQVGIAISSDSKTGLNLTIGSDKGLASPALTAWRKAVQSHYLRFALVPHQDLSWLTVICGAAVVRPGDHSAQMADMIAEFRTKFVARCRRRLPGLRVRGVFEMDLLSPSQFRIGEQKADLLDDLGVDVGVIQRDERILLPHLHAVVDHRLYDRKTLSDAFRAEFAGSRRVLAKPLWTARTVRRELASLAGYSTKLKVAYTTGWAERETKYTSLYEAEWVSSLRQTVEGIGLDGLTFVHGKG